VLSHVQNDGAGGKVLHTQLSFHIVEPTDLLGKCSLERIRIWVELLFQTRLISMQAYHMYEVMASINNEEIDI
jgi:hypothetical protein